MIGGPAMSLPLGEYRVCTSCGSLRGWLLIIPKPVMGLGEILGRLDDSDTTVLCTRCSRGRVSGLSPEYVLKSEPRVIPFWKYLKDKRFEIKMIEISSREPAKGKGLTAYDFVVRINEEFVERLVQLDLMVRIGKPGVRLVFTFEHETLDADGSLKEVVREQVELVDEDRIGGFRFDLIRYDDIEDVVMGAEEEKRDE